MHPYGNDLISKQDLLSKKRLVLKSEEIEEEFRYDLHNSSLYQSHIKILNLKLLMPNEGPIRERSRLAKISP